VAMDLRRLPRRALIDTGILTRSMGDMPPDTETPVCREFYDAMLENGREILIAAPTVAEVIRANGKRSIPRTPQIEVLAFDQVAAEILGRQMPITVLKEFRANSGANLTHLKYDAMIVACAVRYGAECIVAIDDDFEALAPHVGLETHHPREYRLP
jgi:predicted nucleic acid-binding protein